MRGLSQELEVSTEDAHAPLAQQTPNTQGCIKSLKFTFLKSQSICF